MNLRTLHARSLAFFARPHAAVVLCVAVATAVLTGALVVGDSMRGSLRDMALRRLGPVDHALVAPRFFREQLAADIAGDATFKAHFESACPALLLSAAVEIPDTGARQSGAALLGVDERFWSLFAAADPFQVPDAVRPVVLNAALAGRLGARRGDDVLIRLVKPADVPAETLLGRPDDSATTLRLTVVGIIDDDGPGAFGLRSDQVYAQNAYVPLPVLQAALDQRGRVNAIFMTAKQSGPSGPNEDELNGLLARQLQLADAGLRLVENAAQNYVALQSDRLLIEPPVEAAALAAARDLSAAGQSATPVAVLPVLAYLANTIERVDAGGRPLGETRIPYSVVAALDLVEPWQPRFDATPPLSEAPAPVGANSTSVPRTLHHDEILLNQWAADDLAARVGDRIRLEYYVARPLGGLATQTHVFTLAGIVPLGGWAADRGLMPDYRGITDADSLADWDPPDSFQLDLSRIRPRDEDYWKAHRGTPKAFVSLSAGQTLWAEADARHGRLTSILFRSLGAVTMASRVSGSPGRSDGADGANASNASGPPDALDALAARLPAAILANLPPAALGLVLQPVREQALRAGAGSTDFAGLFVAFSFFLIAAAAMLVALIFRLGVERRAREIGLLLALGFSPRQVRRFWLAEGAILAAIGALAGLAGAHGYAWLMLAGLRSWWSGAVDAPFLTMHVAAATPPIGFIAGFLVALASIAWSLRGLFRQSPRALLAGAVQTDSESRPRANGPHAVSRSTSKGRPRGAGTLARFAAPAALTLGLATAMLPLFSNAISPTPAFFAAGAALLIAGLAGLARLFAPSHPAPIAVPGLFALLRLGLRNARRHRGRSLLTAGLIASAAFVIIAVGASRHGADARSLEKTGGAGGYDLIAESVAPLYEDLNAPEGRAALALSPELRALLDHATVMALRLLPGEDTSCLNLYQVEKPRLLGAPDAFIDRGGFAFAGSLAESPDEKNNPWTLLRRTFDDGAIPAVGDANTLTWLLKVGLGDDFLMTDERGQTLRLRIVAMLSGSTLQGELVIAERPFTQRFPSVAGYQVLMIDCDPDRAADMARLIEKDLSRCGLDVESSLDRLNEYGAVENTYMSTFQTLGGLGLLLGTVGLAAVMLRNIHERGGEHALLRAVGFSRAALGLMVFAENAGLLAAGLAIGATSALVAVAPHAAARPGDIDWASLAATLLAVLAAGLASGALVLRSALRTPLLPALRRE